MVRFGVGEDRGPARSMEWTANGAACEVRFIPRVADGDFLVAIDDHSRLVRPALEIAGADPCGERWERVADEIPDITYEPTAEALARLPQLVCDWADLNELVCLPFPSLSNALAAESPIVKMAARCRAEGRGGFLVDMGSHSRVELKGEPLARQLGKLGVPPYRVALFTAGSGGKTEFEMLLKGQVLKEPRELSSWWRRVTSCDSRQALEKRFRLAPALRSREAGDFRDPAFLRLATEMAELDKGGTWLVFREAIELDAAGTLPLLYRAVLEQADCFDRSHSSAKAIALAATAPIVFFDSAAWRGAVELTVDSGNETLSVATSVGAMHREMRGFYEALFAEGRRVPCGVRWEIGGGERRLLVAYPEPIGPSQRVTSALLALEGTLGAGAATILGDTLLLRFPIA